MGYNNIIDSLTSKRVNEWMMTSIKKNTVNKEMKSIIDALLSHNVKKLNKKDLAVDIPMLYNQVGFSKDKAVLQSFYDDILSKLPTSKYSIMMSAYDFLHITFPF